MKDEFPKTVVTPLKAEGASVPTTTALEQEDQFMGLYWSADNKDGTVLQPPYSIPTLERLVEENNALDPCISAYEVNIDGSGYVVEKDEIEIDPKNTKDSTGKGFIEFLREIAPGVSFVSLRKANRRQMEMTGNGYLEVVRSITKEEILFVNSLKSSTMRLLKLGAPVTVTRVLRRFGKDIPARVQVRERFFVQMVGTKKVYFKSFGGTQDINRLTGEIGTNIPIKDRGSEIIHLKVKEAANSPYGVPRWISQVPSVVGSRKAEEVNLEYFESGGIPPVIAFILGGMLGDAVRKQLENIFINPKAKTRGAVVEVHPSGGSLDKESKPSVEIEKFGSESTKDSMFESYDEKCEKRVRRSFRLPPLFVGLSDDYNYASAYISYRVAEGQVFSPEREEFDDIWNMTVMKDLDPTGSYTLRSKQISITNIENQLKALGMTKGMDGIDSQNWVTVLSEIASVDLVYDEEAAEDEKQFRRDLLTGNTQNQNAPQEPGSQVAKGDSDVVGLVEEFCKAFNLTPSENTYTDADTIIILERVKYLNKSDRQIFDAILSARTLPGEYHDRLGSQSLCGCVVDHMIES
ncbi:MAG: hypothetical protein GWN00_01095 [Aliifodinibius sp.]|nr:hypothetical protein [Fodinibius sp.]NIV09927.1 hypothetical protein [Fodinibius sp.]NIY23457.1 hypothetical protein [Fodinibius sp.]